MGVVYRARDAVLDRSVAIKVLNEKYHPGSFPARRFLDEAKITAQLQHPAIPPVHQVGELPDGRPFLVMKLIKGCTLAEILQNGSATAGSLIGIFEQVCQAVAYAHTKGVIHRDLKPQNIMVGAFGEVQVMDWGLAKFRHAALIETTYDSVASTFHDPRSDTHAELRTRTGSFLGTPAYMSPEQAIGAIDQVDEQSDVFGLGGILCAILTGQPPFVAHTPEAIRQLAAQKKLDDAFARLAACPGDPDLIALCRRCLSPEKADRAPAATHLADAVADLREQAERRAREAELDRLRVEDELRMAQLKALERRKRWRIQMLLVVAVGLLMLSGGAFAWWRDRLNHEQRERTARNAISIETLLAQCEAGLTANNSSRAVTPLVEAEKRFLEGGAEQFLQRMSRCRADLEILSELDRINDLRWVVVAGRFSGTRAIASQWPAAFAHFGIVPGKTPIEDAVRRINESFVRDRLLTALDLWLVETRSKDLLALLHAADSESFRDQFRKATVARNGSLLVKLAMGDEAEKQPATFAIVLGSDITVPLSRRRQLLEHVATLRPTDFELLMTLVHLHQMGVNRTDTSSENWIRAALAVRPNNAAARNELGVLHMVKGQLSEAITAFRDSIHADPKLAIPYDNLGLALLRDNQLDAAIDVFQGGIALDPTDVQMRANLAAALITKGDLKSAVGQAQKAIQVNPRYHKAHYLLGIALRENHELDKALASFKAAIKLKPSYPSAYLALGITFRMKQDIASAIAAWREAVTLEPENDIANTMLGETYFKLKEYELAIGSFNNAIKANPNSYDAYVLLGATYRQMGSISEARGAFTKAARLNKRAELFLLSLPAIPLAPAPREVKRP